MDKNPMVQKAVQVHQETPAERELRQKAGFPQTESLLPRRLSRAAPIVDKLTSYLGQRNPLSKEVDPAKDMVWLLDNTAWRPQHPYPHREQPYQAEFVACYFDRPDDGDISYWVGQIADACHLHEMNIPDEVGRATIAQRIQPFLYGIRPARYVNITFPGGDGQKLGPGGRNAISSQVVGPLDERPDGTVIETRTAPETLSPHPMLTHYASPEGWTVISDIDDSIKVTMTPSPIGILKTTFIEDPVPIAGMPELYQKISSMFNPAWFYLSASPYNLYAFLRPFIYQHYPTGTIILRDASWMDLRGFLGSLTQGTQAYKVARIDKIYQWLPKRKILCVGDSTQSDPEAYGEVYRKYKGWVKAIFIRRVTDVSEIKDTDKNTDERFEKAFEGVPRSVWRVFDHPDELNQAVEAMKTL